MSREPVANESVEFFLGVTRRDVIHEISLRKWLILGACLITMVVAAIQTSLRPKFYEAEARVVINPSAPKVIVGDSIDITAPYDAEYYFNVTQQLVIRSPAVLERAASNLKLTESPQFIRDYGLEKEKPDNLVQAAGNALAGMIEIEPVGDSRVVKITIEDYDPERAALIANGVAHSYIRQSKEDRLASTRSAYEWLDERVEDFAGKLEAAELTLFEFKKKHMLVSLSVEDRQNMMATGMSEFNRALVANRVKADQLLAAKKVLQRMEKLEGKPETVPWLAKNEQIESLRAEIFSLQQQAEKLRARYGRNHPAMVSVQKQLQAASGQYDGEVGGLTALLNNELQQLEESRRRLETTMKGEKKKAMHLNNLALEYTKLSREFGTLEETYHALLKRRTEVDLSRLLESDFVKWYQRAAPKMTPVRPSMAKSVLMGASVGLVGAAILVLGILVLSNSIRSREDVEFSLGQVWLGMVPSFAESKGEELQGEQRDRDLIFARDSRGAVAEALRSVRTNLVFLGTNKPLETLLITSADPAEGKTSTLIGLGTAMAQSGLRVLVLDTDLRRPRLHQAFDVPNDLGLSSLLIPSVGLSTEEIRRRTLSTEIFGLDVIPSGRCPPNPTELLHSKRFQVLLEELGKHYDRILLDSPPITAVADAAILSKLVDGTVMVVRAERTRRERVLRGIKQLQDVDARLLGVVLNDVPRQSPEYHATYYASYGASGDGALSV